jgi:hypothetical protein
MNASAAIADPLLRRAFVRQWDCAVRVFPGPKSLSDIAVRDEAKEVRADARPQARG